MKPPRKGRLFRARGNRATRELRQSGTPSTIRTLPHYSQTRAPISRTFRDIESQVCRISLDRVNPWCTKTFHRSARSSSSFAARRCAGGATRPKGQTKNGEFFANPAHDIQPIQPPQSMGWAQDHALALRGSRIRVFHRHGIVTPRSHRAAAVQHCCDYWRNDHRHTRVVDIATFHRTRIELLGRRWRDDSHWRMCCTPQRPRAGHSTA